MTFGGAAPYTNITFVPYKHEAVESALSTLWRVLCLEHISEILKMAKTRYKSLKRTKLETSQLVFVIIHVCCRRVLIVCCVTVMFISNLKICNNVLFT